MGANRPRRNHYIPEMLLKNFCDDGGLLCIADQERGNCYRTNPKNVFVKNNLYVNHDYSRATDSYEYEISLSKIESEAEPAISSLIEQVRCGRHPRLDPELNDHFKKFVIALTRRTPESQERVFSESDIDFEEIFDGVAAGVLRQGGFDVPEKEWFESDPDVLKLKQVVKSNINANFAAGEHPSVRQETERFSREVGWGIARICIPRRSFVIGSQGLTIVGRDESSRRSWLPIAHDVAIWFTTFPDRGFILDLDRNKESLIKMINRATAVQSGIIAGRSENLVRSLMSNAGQRIHKRG